MWSLGPTTDRMVIWYSRVPAERRDRRYLPIWNRRSATPAAPMALARRTPWSAAGP